MALTEEVIIGRREVLSDGQIQIREDLVIKKDGEELSRSFTRYVITPGEDYSSYPAEVQRICADVRTVLHEPITDMHSIEDTQIIPILVKAIQELNDKVTALGG